MINKPPSTLRRLLVVGPVATVLAGCSAPVSLTQWNSDGDYRQKLSRVLVTTTFFDGRMTATQRGAIIRPEELQRSLAAKWGPLGISFEVVAFDAANDRAKATADATASFTPSQIMVLRTTDWETASSPLVSVINGYSIEVGIFDVTSKKSVWRGVVEFKEFSRGGRVRNGPLGKEISHQNDADDFVDVLTARLKADGLI
jgi:hypothetical protein